MDCAVSADAGAGRPASQPPASAPANTAAPMGASVGRAARVRLERCVPGLLAERACWSVMDDSAPLFGVTNGVASADVTVDVEA